MRDAISEDEEQIQPVTVTVEGLLARCHALLGELEDFRRYLAEHKKEHAVELRQFRNSVTSELKSLERVGFLDGVVQYMMLTTP